MSNYPGTLDVFVNKTGSDNIASSDPNNAFDGIEATQGLLGALGKPQSWSTTLLLTMRRYQRGMRVDVAAGTLTARAGEAVLNSTNGNKYVFRHNPADVPLTTANIDVGTIAATFYYVYAKGDGVATTAPICFSTDALAPYGIGTAPYTKIGWFSNEAAAALACTYAGSWREYSNEPNYAKVIGTTDINTTAATYVDMTDMSVNFMTSGKPIRVLFNMGHSQVSSNTQGWVTINIDGTDIDVSTTHVESTAQSDMPQPLLWVGAVAAGAHVIKARWKQSGGTFYQSGDTYGPRILIVEEM